MSFTRIKPFARLALPCLAQFPDRNHPNGDNFIVVQCLDNRKGLDTWLWRPIVVDGEQFAVLVDREVACRTRSGSPSICRRKWWRAHDIFIANRYTQRDFISLSQCKVGKPCGRSARWGAPKRSLRRVASVRLARADRVALHHARTSGQPVRRWLPTAGVHARRAKAVDERQHAVAAMNRIDLVILNPPPQNQPRARRSSGSARWCCR